MKELSYFFATLVVLGWIGVIATAPHSDGDANTPQYVASSATLFFGSIASWISAIYVWSKVPRRGLLHSFALVFLVIFGFLWSHFYLFASARLLPREPSTVG